MLALALLAAVAVALLASRASARPAVWPPAPPGADPQAWARLSQGQREAALRAMQAAPPRRPVARPTGDVVRDYADLAAAPSHWARPSAAPAAQAAPVLPAARPAAAPATDEAAERRRLLVELNALKRYAERLSTYTKAMHASDLIAFRERARALHARGWPVPETARLLADARALRARIAT